MKLSTPATNARARLTSLMAASDHAPGSSVIGAAMIQSDITV